MMKNLTSSIFLVLLSLLAYLPISAQCNSQVEVIIADIDTTYSAIIVEGAINDTLGINGQGLCYVCLNFTHEYLADVLVDLTAPDGTKVLLIGPPSPNSANTQFSEWDICFAAQALPVAPDPGYADIWNSLQQWALLGNYTGTYYPYNSDLGNNLENFNGGPVNGSWTLQFTDISALGEGVLKSFGLVFCDDQGIECITCDAQTGTIIPDTLSYCEGDPNLSFEILPDYGTNPPNENLYDLMHLVIQNDVIHSFDTLVNMMDTLPGSYQICALAVLESSIGDLPIPDGSFGLDSLADLVEFEGLCAAFNDSCYLVEIIDVTDTLFLFETICEGQNFVYKNTVYDQTGVYDINSSTGLCDSITILDLSVTTLTAFINPIIDPITCIQEEEVLQGDLSQFGSNTTFQWYSPNGSFVGPTDEANATVSSGGLYYFVLHNGSCHDTTSIEVLDNRIIPQLNISADTLGCSGAGVEIMLDVDIPYDQVLWTGPQFNSAVEDPTVFVEGIYYVTVSTNAGCISLDSIEVIYDSELENPSFSVLPLTCTEPQTQIVASLTATDYSFFWMGPNATNYNDQSPIVNASGTYELIVTDVNSCTDKHIVQVQSEIYSPPITIHTDTISCADPVANVIIDIDPGTEVLWGGPNGFSAMTTMVDLSDDGLYNIRLTSIDSCILDTFVFINIDTLFPSINLMNDPELNCVDSIQLFNNYLNVTNQTSYLWSHLGTVFSDDPNPWIYNAGLYTVTVTNQNSCPSEASVTVTLGPDAPQIVFDYTDIDCNNPEVTVMPDVSQGYSFQWSGPNGFMHSLPSFTTLTPGAYFVTITDLQSACESYQILSILDNTGDPIIDITGADLDCNLSPVTLSFTTDQMVSSNQWTDPMSQIFNTADLSTNLPGWYYLDVVATSGCSSIDSFEIILNQDPPNLMTVDTFIGCGVNEVTLNVDSDLAVLDYNWIGPGFTANIQNPIVSNIGSYIVTVTAENNCTAVASVEVVADTEQPDLVLIGLDDLDCENSSILVAVVSNMDITSYTWTGPQVLPGDPSVSISMGGTYTIDIQAANGCTNSEEFTINEVDNLPHFDIVPDTISCVSNTATITLIPETNNINFNWTGPNNFTSSSTTITVSIPGEYIIEASTSADCVTTTSYTVVSSILEPPVTNEIINTLNCDSTAVTIGLVSSHNIVSYDWTGPGNFTSDLQFPVVTEPGIYTYEITDDKSCTTIQSIEVMIDTVQAVLEITGSNITCLANKVPLSFTSSLTPVSQSWMGPAGFNTDLPDPSVDVAGIYTLSVTAVNGCRSSASYEVLLDTDPPDINAQDNSLPCNGNGINLEASSSMSMLSYKWFGPNSFYSEEVSPLVTDQGQYFIFVTGLNGCVGSDSLIIDDSPVPPSFGYEVPTINCANPQPDLIALDADDDLLVEWFGPNNFYKTGTITSIDLPGDYLLVVTGQNGCPDSSLLIVPIDTIHPLAVATSLDTLKCTQPEILLDGALSSMGNSFGAQWTTTQGNIVAGADSYFPEINKPGWYTIVVTNLDNGCSSQDSVEVLEEINSLAGAQLEITAPWCVGFNNGTIKVLSVDGGIEPYQYSLDNSVPSNVDNWAFLEENTYDLRIIDAAGCTVDTLVTMPEGLGLSLDLGPDTLIYFGESHTITLNTNANLSEILSVTWIPADLVDCPDCFENEVTPFQTTLYKVLIEHENGCVAEDQITIGIITNETFYIPTAFSPNGDGVNDYFRIFGGKGVSNIESLMILDNWGNILHEAVDFLPDDSSYFWNGIYRAEKLPDGVYTYLVRYSLMDGTTHKKSGTITLLR